MIGRLPLWATLAPLLAGVLLWYWLWDGYRRDLVAGIEAVLPGVAVESGGFPYRLEARIAPLAYDHGGTILGSVRAAQLQVEQQPWQPGRQVLSLTDPVATIAVAGLAGAGATVRAPFAQASLHRQADVLARLSIVWERPSIAVGVLPGPIAASHLEAHLRETPGPRRAPATSPRPPTQAQLVLMGKNVRWRGGDPLRVDLSAEITARRRIATYAEWAGGGTFEVEDLVIADETGEIARIRATVVPDGAGRLRMAGVVDTVCPGAIRALDKGSVRGARERRARRPVRIAFSGYLPGAITLAPADPGRPPAPVRGQEPPCPRLSGS
jgi:hypothetical protein